MSGKIMHIIATTLGVFFLGCDKTDRHWTGGTIDSFGTYIVKDKTYVIRVIRNHGILDYSVASSNGMVVIKAKEHASTYQYWTMYWDVESERLWIESSDIGMFVWQKDSVRKAFYQTAITAKQKNLIQDMPQDFFNSLPELDKEFSQKNGYK